MNKYILILALALVSIYTIHLSANANTKVLAFAGSTREASLNKKLVRQAVAFATQAGADVTFIDLKDYAMPFYDGDLEETGGMPANARALRQMMVDSQVIFIASPCYNDSIPAVLKNALDWASRGENGGSSREAFKGKKFVLMSASPGKAGGVKALVHLRTIIDDIGGSGTVVLQQLALPQANVAFDENGQLKDPKWNQELQELVIQALN